MVYEITFWFCLKDEVAQQACESACEHIATSLMNLMMNDEVKQISMGALQQLNLDTIQCERKHWFFFFFKLPVPVPE